MGQRRFGTGMIIYDETSFEDMVRRSFPDMECDTLFPKLNYNHMYPRIIGSNWESFSIGIMSTQEEMEEIYKEVTALYHEPMILIKRNGARWAEPKKSETLKKICKGLNKVLFGAGLPFGIIDDISISKGAW